MDREYGAPCLMWVWTPRWGPHSQKQLRKQSFGGLGATCGWGSLRGFGHLCVHGNELHA